jgi:hypothetical protein
MTATATDSAEPADVTDAAHRGVLTVADRAVEHLVEAVIARTIPQAMRPDVRVTTLTDDCAELAVTVALTYPTIPLSGVLADVRRRIASETGRQLGRPVRRIDLTVSDFVTKPTRPRVV